MLRNAELGVELRTLPVGDRRSSALRASCKRSASRVAFWERHLVSGPVRIQGVVRFGEDLELDFQSYKLSRGGRVLKLERIPMEILLHLVEQRSQIVTREQIAERIWGKDVFVDTDNSINGAIRKIRHVLRDDSEQPRFIQTITGSGYRFIAAVTDVEVELRTPPSAAKQIAATQAENGRSDIQAQAAGTEPPNLPQRKLPGRKLLFIYAALAVAVAGTLGAWVVQTRSGSAQPLTGKAMLAVLPFQNLTGDSGQDYFSDGLTEEMISRLGNLDPQHIGVIARTSVMHYKNTQTS